MTKCIFCGKEAQTEHHILPRNIRKIMNWHGERAKKCLSSKTVPMCMSCHAKLHLLLEPFVKIIKYLRNVPPVPVEFAFIMEDIFNTLNEEPLTVGEEQ